MSNLLPGDTLPGPRGPLPGPSGSPNMFPAATPKLMLAISSRSPRARVLIDAAAKLASQIQAAWFIVHVRQPIELHYRMAATENPVPEAELEYARSLGGRVIIESGDPVKALVSFASKMSIDYFVTGRSLRPRISFAFQLPLVERIQRKLPNVILIVA